ncbi:MAG TPA: RNA polymerase sigma-70 factor, partial [Dysgonomonas sp.]|nr:RNA polymerase sigma-70 factor [Dysgonomonas sp.]
EEIDKLLTKIINNLPDRCRIIFIMARQEGLKPKAIAERLSINESTVRVQMKIAIEKIIAEVKPHYPDITFTILISLLLS